jgi:hypothetical protein
MSRERNPRDRFDRNIGQRCSVPQCYKPRSGVSQYCNAHRQANAKWGHPTGKYLTERELRPYFREAGQVLKKYASDPATLEALRITHEIITPTAEPTLLFGIQKRTSPTWLLWRETVRLYDARDVDGKPWPLHEREALRAALAVVLYACRNQNRLPTNTAMEYAMAHAVLTLRPLHSYRIPKRQPGEQWSRNGRPGELTTISRKPPGGAKKRLGRVLRERLWQYFEACVQWRQAHYLKEASTASALATFLDARMKEREEAENSYMQRGAEALLVEQSKVLATIAVNGSHAGPTARAVEA